MFLIIKYLRRLQFFSICGVEQTDAEKMFHLSKLLIILIFGVNCYYSLICPEWVDENCTLSKVVLTKTNYELSYFMSPGVKRLRFENSIIPKLSNGVCLYEWPIISPEFYAKLLELDVSNTGVEEILSNTFHECKHLKVIILKNNKITKLEAGLFDKNSQLEKIDLSNNLIEKIPFHFFDELWQLMELQLQGNHLKYFSVDLVRKCESLQVLRIDSNDLFDFNMRKLIEFIPRLKTLALNNNQIRCGKVKEIQEKCEQDNILLDPVYEGVVRERHSPTDTEYSITCLRDVDWVVANYIYTYSKIV